MSYPRLGRPGSRQRPFPFSRHPEAKLRVLVDVVDRSAQPISDLQRILDAAPERIEVETAQVSADRRYVRIGAEYPGGGDCALTQLGDQVIGWSAIGDVKHFRRLAHEFSPQEEARLYRALCLVSYAVRGGFDFVVSDCEGAIRRIPKNLLEHGANVVDADEAISLVGLFLRSQGDYTYLVDQYVRTAGRDGFYAALARALLPESWRWFTSLVHSDNAAEDLAWLGGAALTRVARVMRHRDEIWLATESAVDADAEDALVALEYLLLMLSGAFDVTARIANLVHEVREPKGDLFSNYRVGWQKPIWRTALEGLAPQLAALTADGSTGADTLRAIGSLRNMVHGEGLSGILIIGSGREHLVMVPASEAKTFREVVQRRGGQENWGVQGSERDRLYLDPATFTERLLSDSLELLNAQMRLTDVERVLKGKKVDLEAMSHDPLFGVTAQRWLRSLTGMRR